MAGPDAIIIGGGPAGAAVARLLALWGRRAVVFTRRPPRDTLAESIPPSARKLLAEVGVLDAVERAGFYPTRGNTVWWGRSGMRTETFPSGSTGFQVERRRFDRLLLDRAAAAGAVVREATVRDVRLAPGRARRARVAYERAGRRGTASAPWVLDCSGRAGVIARRGFRVAGPGPRTLAIYAVWQREEGWDLPDATHTLVESYRQGWAWSIPVSPSVRYVAVMVEPGPAGRPRGDRLEDIYHSELAKTEGLRDHVAGATRRGRPRALGASPYGASQFAGPGFLLVGDAASFIDPLSSFGVKKALASAWLAAVVVRTCLAKPELQRAALEFYQAAEQRAYGSYLRLAARFFREVASDYDDPFWKERSIADGAESPAEADVDRLRDDPAVHAAFQELKRRPAAAFRLASDVRTEPRPAVGDREIVLTPHLVSPWMPAGIRYLRGVDLVRLAELAPRCTQVPDLFEAYNRSAAAAVGLPDFLGVLAVLAAKRVLI